MEGQKKILDAKDLAGMIEHTLLKPETTEKQIAQICQEAREYEFAAVCINPCYVSIAQDYLAQSTVSVCTVIGFPLGAGTFAAKLTETQQALRNGADELDMVLNIGWLKSGFYDKVEAEIREIVQQAKGGGTFARVKVILETCLLTAEEKKTACQLAQRAGADFVKTSTGYGAHGATVEDVVLMRQVVGSDMGIKAAGGIKTLSQALAFIQAGANRIGASAGKTIMQQWESST